MIVRSANVPTSAPILVSITDRVDGYHLYWGLGPSGCNWNPAEWEILHEWRREPEEDPWNARERVYKDFDLYRAPEPSEPCPRLGIIAPNGEWYPCGYCCHRGLAPLLGARFGIDRADFEGLKKAGFVSVMGGGLINYDYSGHRPNEAQVSTLLALLEQYEKAEAEGVNLGRTMWANPEGYDSLNGFSSPWNLSTEEDPSLPDFRRQVGYLSPAAPDDDKQTPENFAALRMPDDGNVVYNKRYREDGSPDGD